MKILTLIILLIAVLNAQWDSRYLICKIDNKNKLITNGFVSKDGYYYFKKHIGKDELAPVIIISWLSKNRCKIVSRYTPKPVNVWKILAGK